MTETQQQSKPLLTPRKIIMQVIGFALGVALLVWCINQAIKGGGDGWAKLKSANPLLIAGLISCTLVSLLANGVLFWIVIRPVHPLRLAHMQYLNLVTSVLNYAPIRAGLIARIAYHLRVDRISLILIGGWFAAIGYTFVLALGAVVMATILRPSFDWLWFVLLIVQLIVGGALTRTLLAVPLVQRVGKGMDRMLSDRSALWGAIVLRLVDIGAFAGRMACAAAILELNLSPSQTLLLAVAAMAVSLNPLGRVGFREAGVAFFAGLLAMSGDQFETAQVQLALIESAGEAIVSIPLGAISLLWYRHRWINAPKVVSSDSNSATLEAE